jgi:hypothetical protein
MKSPAYVNVIMLRLSTVQGLSCWLNLKVGVEAQVGMNHVILDATHGISPSHHVAHNYDLILPMPNTYFKSTQTVPIHVVIYESCW